MACRPYREPLTPEESARRKKVVADRRAFRIEHGIPAMGPLPKGVVYPAHCADEPALPINPRGKAAKEKKAIEESKAKAKANREAKAEIRRAFKKL